MNTTRQNTCGTAGKCKITCEFGCGCISKPDGSKCSCYCTDSNGGIDCIWDGFDIDEPMSLNFNKVSALSLAEGLARAFAGKIARREMLRDSLIEVDDPNTTLRRFAPTIGLYFA